MNDYLEFRGKCKELSESLVKRNPDLRLIRGHYYCPIWGKQEHWWCINKSGDIIDPTKNQFPSKGEGQYIEFNGMCECAECGEFVEEDIAMFAGRYPICSDVCYGKFVGVFL